MQARTRGVAVGAVLLIAVVALGAFLFSQSSRNGSTAGQPPTKPTGTQFANAPTTEQWTVAQGLPAQVMRLAFSAADPTRGYASAFVTKQEQHIYRTTDRGNIWSQVGVLHGPVSDILSTDPLDPQDVVSLSVYAPIPGTYSFQRSVDGGKTWSNETTDLPTTGEVSQTGWSDSTFVVGFQLDGQLQGSSALVAFPKGQASVHLDDNGKINGTTIAHFSLITGRHGKVIVWGDDGSSAQNIIALSTTDLGKSWTMLPSTAVGKSSTGVAASDDGGVIVARSVDHAQLAISSDDGNTWTASPALAAALQSNQNVFVTSKSKTLVILGSDGAYALRNDAWSRITSKSVTDVSDGSAGHAARLWALDGQGRVIWFDV